MEPPSQEALIQELRLCQDENRNFRSRLTRIIKWIRVIEAQGTKIPNEVEKDLDLNFESASLRNQPLQEHLELKIERSDEPDEVEAEDVDMDYFFGPLQDTDKSTETESSHGVQMPTDIPKTLSTSKEFEIRIVDISTIVNAQPKLSAAAAGTSPENTQNQLPVVMHPVEPAKTEQSFNCRDCTAEFSTVYELIAHAMTHLTPHLIPGNTNSVTKSVKKPAKSNISKTQLKATKTKTCQRRLKEPLTRCPKCRVFLKNAASLSVHMARAHEGKLYQCNICLKVVKSESSCNAHFQIHHRDFINSVRMENCFTRFVLEIEEVVDPPHLLPGPSDSSDQPRSPRKVTFDPNDALIQNIDEDDARLLSKPCNFCFSFHVPGGCVVLKNRGDSKNKPLIAANKVKLWKQFPDLMKERRRAARKRNRNNKRSKTQHDHPDLH